MVLKGNDYVKRIRSTLRRIRSTLLRTEVCFKRSQVPRFMLNETKCTMSLKLQIRTQWGTLPVVSAPDLPTTAHLEGKAHQGDISPANVTPHTHPDTQETSLSQTEHTSAPGKGYPGNLERVHGCKTKVFCQFTALSSQLRLIIIL